MISETLSIFDVCQKINAVEGASGHGKFYPATIRRFIAQGRFPPPFEPENFWADEVDRWLAARKERTARKAKLADKQPQLIKRPSPAAA